MIPQSRADLCRWFDLSRQRVHQLVTEHGGLIEAHAYLVARGKGKIQRGVRGLGEPGRAVLAYVTEHPGVTTAEIAKGIRSDTRTVGHTIAYLDRVGYVRAERGPGRPWPLRWSVGSRQASA